MKFTVVITGWYTTPVSPTLPWILRSCHQYISICTWDEYANKTVRYRPQMQIGIQERANGLQNEPGRGGATTPWDCKVSLTGALPGPQHTQQGNENSPPAPTGGTPIQCCTVITGLYTWRWHAVTGPGTTAAPMNLSLLQPHHCQTPETPHYLPHQLLGLRNISKPNAAKRRLRPSCPLLPLLARLSHTL